MSPPCCVYASGMIFPTSAATSGRLVARARGFEAVAQLGHQFLISGIPADWLEQRIGREPWVAREAVVDRGAQPGDRFLRLSHLRERRAEAERDVVIHGRASLEGLDHDVRGGLLAGCSEHGGEHGLGPDVGFRSTL